MSAPVAARPLARGMKVLGVLFLTLSAETPASSVFVILPGVVQAAGTGALISMAAAGIVALCMALTYAEMGSAFPSAGGEYAIVGSVLGPTSAFAMLGVNALQLVMACAVLALGMADYLRAALPGVAPVPVAVAAVAAATGLGVLNVRTNAVITGAFLAVELAALAVVTVLGFAHPARGVAELLAHPMALAPGGPLQAVGLGGLAMGVVVGLFAYDGYGSAIYLAEEVLDARTRLVRAVFWALAATTATELLSLTAVLVSAPDLKALVSAGDGMMTAFVASRGGSALAAAVGAGVALAIFNAVIALVLVTARQVYATARDGAWPQGVNRALAGVHPRFGSPVGATLLTGAFAVSLCLVPLNTLLLLSGAGITLIYIGLTIACLRQGARRGQGAGWRMPLWPGPPAAALVLLIAFAAAGLKDGATSFAVNLAAAGLAAAYHRWVLGPRGGWAPRGPSVDEP